MGRGGFALSALLAAALAAGACVQAPAPAAVNHDIPLPVESQSVDAIVPPNATFETLLRGQSLTAVVTLQVLQAVKAVFNPKDLRAHQAYRVTRSQNGLLREFTYHIDDNRLLSVHPAAGAASFTAEVITLAKTVELEALSVVIGRGQSLVGVLGDSLPLALQLADIYGGEVDFNTDLQPGDRLECLVERVMREGAFAGYGAVRAAVLVNSGRRLPAILFADDAGAPAYFDEDGRSLKRQFLKSPLPFDPRVTSGFSYHRLHPVHGDVRAHLGVDLGAPYGTPVKTVASGIVDFAGMNGEAGRMVRVRHSGGYQTAYLHLSALSPGIRAGARVAQGDVIGRVGSSGTATGPHLDYRIIKNGTYVNPMVELRKMPKGEPIAGTRLAAFSASRDLAIKDMTTRLAEAAAHAAPAGSEK